MYNITLYYFQYKAKHNYIGIAKVQRDEIINVAVLISWSF